RRSVRSRLHGGGGGTKRRGSCCGAGRGPWTNVGARGDFQEGAGVLVAMRERVVCGGAGRWRCGSERGVLGCLRFARWEDARWATLSSAIGLQGKTALSVSALDGLL